MTASIRIEENGPLRVEGEFDLIGSNGEKMSEGTWMKIALCRCGRSAKKPFCDGSHKISLKSLPKLEIPDHQE